jgi:hypothetical protein
MGTATTLTAGLASLPDPAMDRPGKPVPEAIAAVLSILAILTEYGRHLAGTLEHRAVWSGFATIVQFWRRRVCRIERTAALRHTL